jgi:hypothetical protein
MRVRVRTFCVALLLIVSDGASAQLPPVPHYRNPFPPFPAAPVKPPNYTAPATKSEPANDPGANPQRGIDGAPVVFGLWVAIFTAVLAGSAVGSWMTAGRQGTARRALAELERPFLVVEVTEPGIEVDANGNFSLAGRTQWAAFNYGRTPAILVERRTAWPVEAGMAMPDAVKPVRADGVQFPAGCVATDGRPYFETANLMAEAPIQRLYVPYAWRETRIFFIGFVRYADVFGALYVSGFCFVFDHIGRRFVRTGGEEYNYTRVENRPGEDRRVRSLPSSFRNSLLRFLQPSR